MRIKVVSFTRGKDASPYSLEIGNQVVEAGAGRIQEHLKNICLFRQVAAQPMLPSAL